MPIGLSEYPSSFQTNAGFANTVWPFIALHLFNYIPTRGQCLGMGVPLYV